ncbi:hypothetical protein ACPA9J_00625 [Pseudomonas aeruginosa]
MIGVMGLDINLSNLQALSEQGNRELYDGVGQVGILQPGRAVRRQQPRRRPARQEPGQGGSAARRRTPATAGRRQEPGCSTRTTTSRCCNRCSRFPAPSPGACSSKCRRAPCSARPWRWSGNWTTCVAKAPGSNWPPEPRRRGARPAGAVAERPRRDPADPRRRPHAARHRQRRR